jgi:hypothetical protein
MTANFPHKDFSFLKPFMEHGISPIIKGMIYPVSGYVELGFILYLNQYIDVDRNHFFNTYSWTNYRGHYRVWTVHSC